MAGAACKIIINNMLLSLSAGLEKVVTSPLVRGPMISEEQSNAYLQRLADIDIATYSGKYSRLDCLSQVAIDLEKDGVFTAEIWEILHKPGSITATASHLSGTADKQGGAA